MYKNNIDLIGFIGSDPEARCTDGGTAVTTFSLATKSSWKNESGVYQSRTEWHRMVAWGKLAESAAKLAKGAHIEVEGELRIAAIRRKSPLDRKPRRSTYQWRKSMFARCVAWIARAGTRLNSTRSRPNRALLVQGGNRAPLKAGVDGLRSIWWTAWGG